MLVFIAKDVAKSCACSKLFVKIAWNSKEAFGGPQKVSLFVHLPLSESGTSFIPKKSCPASFVYMILWERVGSVFFCLHVCCCSFVNLEKNAQTMTHSFQNHFCQAADVRLVQAHSEGHGGHNHPQLPWEGTPSGSPAFMVLRNLYKKKTHIH